MPSLIEFLPLRSETILTVRARLDSDVNAGLAPEDPLYIDTIEGGFYFDMTQPVALEMERLWDFLSTEVPAVAFVTFAFGDYLDRHGEVLGVPRKEPAVATGFVTFTGTDGVGISTGTSVAVPTTDPDSIQEISFRTTAGGTITGGTLTLPVEAEETGSAWNVSSGMITLMLSPVEGIATIANAEATGGGADIEEDEPYRTRLLLELSSPGGQGNVADYERWALATAGVGFVRVNPLWKGPGTVQVLITDEDNDPVPSVVEDGLQNLLDPPVITTTLNGAQNLSSATLTVPSTTGFRTASVGDPQFLNILDYIHTYTGKTPTTFTGVGGGPSLVAPSGSVVAQGGIGAGLAPIGAEVTVDTPTTTTINVAGTITTYEDYSLDGDAATTAIREDIQASVERYVNSRPPGEDVKIAGVRAALFAPEGVYNVTGATSNGSAADVAISSDPPSIAKLGTLTLTWAGAEVNP